MVINDVDYAHPAAKDPVYLPAVLNPIADLPLNSQ